MCDKCSPPLPRFPSLSFPNHLFPKARLQELRRLRVIGFKNDISLSGVTHSEQFVLPLVRVTSWMCSGQMKELETQPTEELPYELMRRAICISQEMSRKKVHRGWEGAVGIKAVFVVSENHRIYRHSLLLAV